MQQPPHDQQRNNQQNPQQHQGGQASKAGMLPPSQQPRPPPLPPPPGTAAGSDKQKFEVCGKYVPMYPPFASQFGDRLRDEMPKVYDADNDPMKTTAKATCRPVMNALRKATGMSSVCDKWITTGRCRQKDCPGAHPEWDKAWDGQWLTAQCPELAAMAGVPLHWAP